MPRPIKTIPTAEEARKISLQRLEEAKSQLDRAKELNLLPSTIAKLQYFYEIQKRYCGAK